MTQSFNLNTFLQEYRNYTNQSYTPEENAKSAMEQRALAQAEEAVKESGLLTLTLSEKLAELGIGERVLQQFGDTALGFLKDFVNPITDYLTTYQNIFDQDAYNAEIQAYGKQMFFAHQAMAEEAAESVIGQNFSYDM